MIYPTRLAILVMAAGAPLALLLSALYPGLWAATLAWPLGVLLVGIADAALGTPPARARVALALPSSACVGADIDVTVRVAVAGRAPPRRVEVALALGPLVSAPDDRLSLPLEDGTGAGDLRLTAVRRGTARFDSIWIRWRSRLGLSWSQRLLATADRLPIMPDIRPVRERGAEIFQRYAQPGLIAQAARGQGAEFESLVEYRPGMDRRAIDWNQSARHLRLHARDYRSEQNAHIVMAIDSGRQMSEPVAGVPRVDRAITAALLAMWVALKLGDRVALFSYDSRPRHASGTVAGTRAFPLLQRLAARIDYSGEETNYTFALSTLAGRLERRSLIVLFTEFADLTSAQLMVRAATRLARKHLLLVVVLHDEELETIAAAAPMDADDVTRAVTAAALLRERQLVLRRLRHLGAHVIESGHDAVGERLVAGYVDLKKRNLL